MNEIVAVIVALSSGAILGVVFGCQVTDASWQKICIDRGFAQYNPKTGKFELLGDKS